MIGTHAEFFVEHWPLAVVAGAAGFVLLLAYLVAEYLALPAWRLYAARRCGAVAVEELVRRERARLRRLEDDAAIHEEHMAPNACSMRGEADLERLVVDALERRARAR